MVLQLKEFLTFSAGIDEKKSPESTSTGAPAAAAGDSPPVKKKRAKRASGGGRKKKEIEQEKVRKEFLSTKHRHFSLIITIYILGSIMTK